MTQTFKPTQGQVNSGEGTQAAPEPTIEGLNQPNVTLDQLNQRLDEFFSKRVQSYVDSRTGKLGNTVSAEVQQLQKQIAEMRNSGIQISPEQEQAMLQKKEQETQGSQPAPQSPGAQGQEPEQTDPITKAALDLEQAAGVELLDEDPEVKQLDYSNAYKFLSSLEKALAAKKERVGDAAQQQVSPTLQTPGALPSGGTPGTFAGQDGGDLLKQYFSSKRGD